MVVLSNFMAPQEDIRHVEQDTTVYIDKREIGKGTLYITESVLSWVDSTKEQGFSLKYPHISIHAISRDVQVHPKQCLYIMVDSKIDLPDITVSQNNKHSSGDDDDDDAESETDMTEMRFVPDNINNLENMFHAMTQCQALHPDPQDSFSDDNFEIYEDAEENNESEITEAPYILASDQLARNDNGLDQEAMDVCQFEDAKEELHDH